MECCQYNLQSKEARSAAAKGKIEWQMWANALGVFAAVSMIVGGAVGVTSDFNRKWAAAYSLIAGCVVLSIEWPRSKRLRGRTMPRSYQYAIGNVVARVPLLHNLFVRFGLYLVMAIPCFFELPSILGGAVLVIASGVYLLAAFKNETWKHLQKPKKRVAGGAQVIAVPKQAPPRLPPSAAPPKPADKKDSPTYARKDTEGSAAQKVEANASFAAPARAPPQAPNRAPPPKPTPQARALPPRTTSAQQTWVQTTDETTGETYYYNQATKETQWQRPSGNIELESDSVA